MKGSMKTIEKEGLKILTFYPYKDFGRGLLLQYKDGKDRWLAPVFLKPYEFLLRLRYHNYVFIGAPSSQDMLQIRGYYPVYEILKAIDLKTDTGVLMKTENVKQSLQDGKLRKSIKDYIVIHNLEFVRNKKVVLFDDLVTTGSTLRACYDLLIPHVDKLAVIALFRPDEL